MDPKIIPKISVLHPDFDYSARGRSAKSPSVSEVVFSGDSSALHRTSRKLLSQCYFVNEKTSQ